MKRLVATFDDSESVADARRALRDADLQPAEPDIENPFFDPATSMPEGRGLLWGGVTGGVIGALVLFALSQNAFAIPRISPIMTAGTYMLVVLGFGLGVAVGSFFGGVVGSLRSMPERDEPRLAVLTPDHRTDEAADLLRDSGAKTVNDAVTHHEHPLRRQATDTATTDRGE